MIRPNDEGASGASSALKINPSIQCGTMDIIRSNQQSSFQFIIFYNNACEVDQEKLQQVLSNLKEENVVGWYRQRRNSSQQMSFKEQLVHQSLRRALPYQELVFMLLTPSEATASGSTHRLEYTAFIWSGSRYSSVPVSVSNLGTLEQQDYWRVSSTCPSLSHCRTVQQHRSKFFSSGEDLSEVEKVSDMNDALLDEMKGACVKVEKSERRVEKLQAEIAQLRHAIRGKKEEQQQGQTAEGSTAAEEPGENVLLCTALRTLFPSSAAFRTRTLSVRGFPVLEMCCRAEHRVDVSARLPLLLQRHPVRNKRRRSGGSGTRGRAQTPGSSVRSKRRRNGTDSSDGASGGGSDTEVEGSSPHASGSPVF
ncbi:BRCA1-A complex subunit Abraxas 1 isoform X2 [Trichomycterus rosablanca]|uniref:BRCA1-A complex subunit Abraxas 1 isoform X2 n=1 Tax=Trichomycterus rosablanca TaxID=2290929 RepID=UPI002F35D9E1